MKRFIALFFLVAIAAAGASAMSAAEAAQGILWYGQSSLRMVLDGKVVWIDPVNVSVAEQADLILVTHSHGDHYSAADIKKLSGPSTAVLVGFDAEGLSRIKPGDKKTFGNLVVEAVPAYNIVKAQNHPKASQFCGFVLSAQGVRIYVAGDTERIPEMKSIVCDVAILPLGQTYTMGSVGEAVQAALDVKAKVALPYHYGLYEGTQADADKFVADLGAAGVQSFQMKKR